MKTDIRIVIPARYGSTRLPGKPLALLDGVPMIVRTARNALQTGFPIVVAYDDARVGEVLAAHDIPAVLTRTDHENGTQRLSEVAAKEGWSADTLVINVQGDEPLLPAKYVKQVAETLMAHPEADVATLAADFAGDDPCSPNMVKVVRDLAGHALYFSRSIVPCVRGEKPGTGFAYLRHIGIYAYRVGVLQAYPTLASTPLEEAEKLEQLRFLEHGYKIAVDVTDGVPPAGVDSAEDVARVSAVIQAGNA